MNAYAGKRTRVLQRSFFRGLLRGLRLTWPILSALIGLMIVLGLIVGRLEGWNTLDSIYFAFVTGLTIGYGDFAPKLPLARSCAIVIGLTGILLTGMVAAISVQALQHALSPRPAEAAGRSDGMADR